MSGELHVDIIVPDSELEIKKKLTVDTDLTVKEKVILEQLNIIDAQEMTGSEHIVIRKSDATLGGITPDSLMPPGSILPFGGINVPDGWLLCDGTQYTKTDFPRLYDAIETTWGGNAAVFNVPDLRGIFLRGLDQGRGYDSDSSRNLGSYQEDAFQGHRFYSGVPMPYNTPPHHVYASTSDEAPGEADYRMSGSAGNGPFHQAITSLPKNDGNHGDPRTSSETRPKNAAVNYIIKY